jgi:hypothetical protein
MRILYVNVANVGDVRMRRMCGYEGNVTNYEECEGARGERVG